MKKPLRYILLVAWLVFCGDSVQGALSYWDANDSAPGAGASGSPSGSWGSDPFWSTAANGTASTSMWTPDDTAVFSAGSDALYACDVTLFTNQSVAGIRVEEGQVTLTNGIITLTGAGGSIEVASSASASINSTLTGTNGMSKIGSGTLYFINPTPHNYTSDGGTATNTTITGGALSYGNGTLAGEAEADSLRGHHIINHGTLIFDRNGAMTSFSGVISGTGGFMLRSGPTNGGGAVLKLASLYTNTYSGDTIIYGGRLQTGGSSGRCIPTGPGNGNVYINTNGILDVQGNNVQVNGLFGFGKVTNSFGYSGVVPARTNILTVGDNDQSSTFSGLIYLGSNTRSNHVVLNKIGSGTLTLTGASTYYAAPTVIYRGTLLANNTNGSATGGSTVIVKSGATLGGNGKINGPVVIEEGGTLSPGSAVGTLTINNSLTNSGDLFIEVNKSLFPSNDIVKVTGTLTNAGVGTLTVKNLGPTLAAGDTFYLFQDGSTNHKPVLNGGVLTVVLAEGGVVWNNNLAVDGSISVASVSGGGSVTPPTITSIVGAGTASVTVNYSNTVAGTNYVVQYRTNLNVTNWTSLSPVTASGPTSSSTDAPSVGDPLRLYRVSYVTP